MKILGLKTKNQTHSESFLFVRIFNKRNLGLNNTNSGTYYMISPRVIRLSLNHVIKEPWIGLKLKLLSPTLNFSGTGDPPIDD